MGVLGLVFASHGTTDGQAYRRDILPVVEALRSFATARGLPFAPACVSARVREGLRAQKIKAPGVREAVAQLTGEGAGRVLVMPSHLVGGSTYQALEDEAAALGVPPPIMRFTIMGLLKRGLSERNIWVSQERRMCCGLGKCGHCRIKDRYVCLDGPVFNYIESKDMLD